MSENGQSSGGRGLAAQVGAVVIGRNEGDRLRRCLDSLLADGIGMVYVDSGSTDDSIDLARRVGVDVVDLDMSIPFCAARARNAGYRHLMESRPHLDYVQFVDGDCEIVAGWLPSAVEFLASRPQCAVAAGWLHEKAPEASIYNRLGDLEWNFAGAGPVEAVGGIFMIRRSAFDDVGGFDQTVAAGEEPELCNRLSGKGWQMVRLDRDMALHDLAMTHFRQWWRRMVRNGYGAMDVSARFGIAKFTAMTRRARLWTSWLLLLLALAPIVAAVAGSAVALAVTAALFAIWPAYALRIALRTWKKGHPVGTAAAYAVLTAIAFMPQFAGQLHYLADRLRKRRLRLVEYRSTPPSRCRGPN